MIEIRMHGRGGQGAAIACKILALAVFKEGKYAQSFPAFGVERRGAPVVAYTRIDTKPIQLRCEIYEPDHIIVLDPTLMLSTNVIGGLKKGGTILINSNLAESFFKIPEEFRSKCFDANTIAVKYHLGTKTIPIVNTAILGAFVKYTGVLSIDKLSEAIEETVPSRTKENVEAVRESYDLLTQQTK
ncbi:MAG: pyruvate ferredoxin oxidoreductase [Candidatus Fischerbacteria bacterium RBG_13_37_8]|uniref:Pyruvate ferredoxin oxidoreductase n=1 Tax=Candidatus Fischerbacteria bacterium RBG_13_37_8 TaxID=1817863 RepID=A0A1F5V4U0_9BACT|nr:MAG: pyruvate ferredoxin oxidoreductase [Candidatus Fischerbacteria bacterium RBG_13_37_8]